MNYFVYIVQCADNTFYTGITTNVLRRLNEHNGMDGNKKGAKYTSVRRPVFLVYLAGFEDRSSAAKEEYRIKQLSRKEKEKIIALYP